MATPDPNSPQVKAFMRAHLKGAKPIWVPQVAAVDGVPGDCFGNVAAVVKGFGGRMLLGWHLWEMPGLMVEGELHAVWMDFRGGMMDITPQLPGFEEEET